MKKQVVELSPIKHELTKWWGITDYVDDIGSHLKERELHRFCFFHKSPQAEYRSKLVVWLKELGLQKNLDRSCIHLAVYILDIFMDNYAVPKQQLYLVALVALLLAAKYDERDVKIPKIVELNSQLKNPYPVSDFHAMEIKIMILFDWYLGVPTASHFTDYYSMCVILDNDCKCIKKMDCERALWREAVQYIHKFLDIILLDINLMQAQPSLIASSIICATRILLKLLPIWPPQLVAITNFNFVDILKTVEILFRELNPMIVQYVFTTNNETEKETHEIDNSEDNYPQAKRLKTEND
ncbi:cyclin-J [Chrysoperla carnea]|uniref:cyclin-J n=1 Tax=Chrysoperla carnea TaxID=189513 RepID=UPI001D092BD4|nr:cyclin-J [Chrysoperla carnea]